MNNIIKRNDNRYMIRKQINGQQIIKYAKTIIQAKQILQNIKNGKIKYNKKEIIKNYTLKEYTNIWLNLYKKPFVKNRTYLDIMHLTERFTKILGKIKIKELTTNQIQTFLNEIPRTRTKDKIKTYFNAILQKASDTNVIDKNPFNAVIRDKKVKCKNNAYNYEEQKLILNAVKNTNIEHEILIYLLCGCRPNELPNKSNFDFENKIINIYGTKNDNALHRQIEMSDKFAKYIKDYFLDNEIQSESYISKKFIQICKDLNIEKPLLYRLRHTFATNHFTLGTQPKLVQSWLGHASISMTLDTYTDIDKTLTKEKIIELYNNYYFIKNNS